MQESWNRQVVLAISTMKEFEAFLESDFPWGVLMEFHIALLQDMVRAAHAKKKKVLFHLELLRGISADEAGCEFACQRLGADGIISTRPKVVETAKKNKIRIIKGRQRRPAALVPAYLLGDPETSVFNVNPNASRSASLNPQSRNLKTLNHKSKTIKTLNHKPKPQMLETINPKPKKPKP